MQHVQYTCTLAGCIWRNRYWKNYLIFDFFITDLPQRTWSILCVCQTTRLIFTEPCKQSVQCRPVITDFKLLFARCLNKCLGKNITPTSVFLSAPIFALIPGTGSSLFWHVIDNSSMLTASLVLPTHADWLRKMFTVHLVLTSGHVDESITFAGGWGGGGGGLSQLCMAVI